jgi:hypothetical protein
MGDCQTVKLVQPSQVADVGGMTCRATRQHEQRGFHAFTDQVVMQGRAARSVIGRHPDTVSTAPFRGGVKYEGIHGLTEATITDYRTRHGRGWPFFGSFQDNGVIGQKMET